MPLKALFKNTLISVVILFIVYMIFFYELDIPLMYFIYEPFVGTLLAHVCTIMSKAVGPYNWFVLGLIALVYVYGQHRKGKLREAEPVLRWGAAVVTAFIVLAILKVTLGRYRPIALLTDNLYGFHFFSFKHDGESTPSGHATMSFAALFGLSRLWKKGWITGLLLLPAILIALSRLVIADHYVSDVFFGAYLGVLSVIWVNEMITLVKARFCA